MPYYVYILRNEESGALYTRYTSDSEKCLSRHNHISRVTKRYAKKCEWNWFIVHYKEYETKSEAMQREYFLISGQERQLVGAYKFGEEHNIFDLID